ncbi:unnamed protein product [Polarella glacialis]|uniref:EF-hand domain-containing protein n=1 Tax=Polarella glacialis TaxID=89957 RepID=A0A813DGI0_POLGL|nr:unnamed protein product [Polarella glacialis]
MRLLTPRSSSTPRGKSTQNSHTERKEHWSKVRAISLAAAKAELEIVKPLTLLGGGDKPRLPPLPPSLTKARIPGKNCDAVQSTYHWRPVQVKEHEQSEDDPGRTLGTYINTLSYHLDVKSLGGATPTLIRPESNNFTAQDSIWCYLVTGNLVICKGVVIGTCPRDHDPATGRNIRIARLPVEVRPHRALQFAALSREAYDVGGHVTYTSSLVTLVVTPDGWISGVSGREMEGAIDLSAIRYCLGNGISLTDEVSLHAVDVGGSRLVCLQGTLLERYHVSDSRKPLAMLPESCRPPREIEFVVSGGTPGGFNLMVVRPLRGGGIGGDLMWKDAVWNHDRIHLTGMMYEVAADAMPFSTQSSWSEAMLKVFVHEFQNFLVRKYGSVEASWESAFHSDASCEINFTEFSIGCKNAGYVGNATRLWAAFDEDHSGRISLEELAGVCGELEDRS